MPIICPSCWQKYKNRPIATGRVTPWNSLTGTAASAGGDVPQMRFLVTRNHSIEPRLCRCYAATRSKQHFFPVHIKHEVFLSQQRTHTHTQIKSDQFKMPFFPSLLFLKREFVFKVGNHCWVGDVGSPRIWSFGPTSGGPLNDFHIPVSDRIHFLHQQFCVEVFCSIFSIFSIFSSPELCSLHALREHLYVPGPWSHCASQQLKLSSWSFGDSWRKAGRRSETKFKEKREEKSTL